MGWGMCLEAAVVAPPLLLPALVLLMDVATEDVDPLGEGVELTALFAEVAVVELLSSDCGGREDDTADVAAVVGTTVVTLPFAVLEAFPGMELPVDVLVAVGGGDAFVVAFVELVSLLAVAFVLSRSPVALRSLRLYRAFTSSELSRSRCRSRIICRCLLTIAHSWVFWYELCESCTVRSASML